MMYQRILQIARGEGVIGDSELKPLEDKVNRSPSNCKHQSDAEDI